MGGYICVVIYSVLAFIWILLLIGGGKKYQQMIEPLEISKYPLKGLFPAGFYLLEKIKYSYNTSFDVKRLSQSKIVYGEKYGEYYYRVSVAEKVTLVSICIVLGPLLGALGGNPLYSLFGLFAAGIAFYYVDSKITDVMSAREDMIIRDFSDMVSKMALLINAGMITREAWEEISLTGEGVLYDEMRQSVLDMQNGESEVDAYISFANRCGVTYVKKFVSMLVQNLSKGNKELVDFLKAETTLAWEEKKHAVRRQGEKASNKMMIPLGMILIGIFIMVLIPLVGNMGL